jgi:hypothetical protein
LLLRIGPWALTWRQRDGHFGHEDGEREREREGGEEGVRCP